MNPTPLKLVVNWLPLLDVWWLDTWRLTPDTLETEAWQLLLLVGIDEQHDRTQYRLLAYCPALDTVDTIFVSDTASVYIGPPDNPKGITA